MDKERKWNFDTLQVHAGAQPDPATGARAVPIYQTSSYVFKDTQHAADLFALREPGNIYTRLMNPTTEVLEKRMAALEGGAGALGVASGQSAITYAILNIAGTGDEIVSANSLYGGTHNLFSATFPRMGIKTRFVNPNDPENFRKALTEKTRAVYIETIGNPGINIIDIEEVARIAHEQGVPLIVDNTFATPVLCRPIEFGADVVVHSATKFIGGHGTSIGGVIVDSGKFDWAASGKFPGLTEPDPSYHGIKYVEALGPLAYITKIRVQLLRDVGAAMSPFNAFLFCQGLETLSLRVRKHVDNTRRVVEFLKEHPKITWVNYPELPDSPYRELARKYLPQGSGSIFTFGVKGGLEAGKTFIEALDIFSLLANVADTKSLVIHPASTTHQQMNEQDQADAGITPDMIRVSIGIEDANDLIADIKQALDRI